MLMHIKEDALKGKHLYPDLRPNDSSFWDEDLVHTVEIGDIEGPLPCILNPPNRFCTVLERPKFSQDDRLESAILVL
ncbi:hypothetical protein Ancab_032284 [Ancistrocladus abbreviatus]